MLFVNLFLTTQAQGCYAALLMTYCNGPHAEPDYDLFDDISMLSPVLSPLPAHLVDKLRGSQLSDVAQQVFHIINNQFGHKFIASGEVLTQLSLQVFFQNCQSNSCFYENPNAAEVITVGDQ